MIACSCFLLLTLLSQDMGLIACVHTAVACSNRQTKRPRREEEEGAFNYEH
jgi:hypothetical protein